MYIILCMLSLLTATFSYSSQSPLLYEPSNRTFPFSKEPVNIAILVAQPILDKCRLKTGQLTSDEVEFVIDNSGLSKAQRDYLRGEKIAAHDKKDARPLIAKYPQLYVRAQQGELRLNIAFPNDIP